MLLVNPVETETKTFFSYPERNTSCTVTALMNCCELDHVMRLVFRFWRGIFTIYRFVMGSNQSAPYHCYLYSPKQECSFNTIESYLHACLNMLQIYTCMWEEQCVCVCVCLWAVGFNIQSSFMKVSLHFTTWIFFVWFRSQYHLLSARGSSWQYP